MRPLAPPASVAPDLTLVAHFLYGAGCGALIAAADPRIGRGRRRDRRAAGSGLFPIWAGSRPRRAQAGDRHPLRRNAVMIAAHFVWGWSTAEAMRELDGAPAKRSSRTGPSATRLSPLPLIGAESDCGGFPEMAEGCIDVNPHSTLAHLGDVQEAISRRAG